LLIFLESTTSHFYISFFPAMLIVVCSFLDLFFSLPYSALIRRYCVSHV
jgi:hypothetical protein